MSPRDPLPDQSDSERWTVYGIPTFITRQVDPGDVIAFSMIYEPTEDRDDRYRISAVKVTGIASDQEVPPSPWRVRCGWCGRTYVGHCICRAASDQKQNPMED